MKQGFASFTEVSRMTGCYGDQGEADIVGAYPFLTCPRGGPEFESRGDADHLVTAMASIQAKAAEVVLLPCDKGTIGRLGRAIRETCLKLSIS